MILEEKFITILSDRFLFVTTIGLVSMYIFVKLWRWHDLCCLILGQTPGLFSACTTSTSTLEIVINDTLTRNMNQKVIPSHQSDSIR